MKLFENVRTYFEVLGFYSVQTNQVLPFNIRNVLMPLSVLIMLISTIVFLLFKADIMVGYAISFFLGISLTTALIVYFIFMLKMSKIIEFIEKCERFVGKSKWATDMLSNSHFPKKNHFIYLNRFFKAKIFISKQEWNMIHCQALPFSCTKMLL